MSQAPKAKPPRNKAQRPHYKLRLYVIGDGPNSTQALTNLHSLCQEHLQGRCTIETVDVAKDLGAAAKDNILITPALILLAPLPRVVVLGNLSDRKKLLLALRLTHGDV